MMNFFDYDQDLDIFESLMKDVDDRDTLVESDDNVIYSLFEANKRQSKGKSGQSKRSQKNIEEKATESDQQSTEDKSDASNEQPEQKIRGSVIANAIKNVLDVGETDKRTVSQKRNALFRAAYFDQKEPFSLGQADQYVITNDSGMTDSYFKIVDDTHIAVNFSLLVRTYTTKAFDKTIQSLGKTWKKATATTLVSPFSKAIEKALNMLIKIIDSGAYGTEDENNPIIQKKKKAEERKQKKLNQQEPNQQEPKQEEPKQEEPKKNTEPDKEPTKEGEPEKKPAQEEEPNVEVPEDDDPKKLYSAIMKDFRENYQQNLEADCDARKDDIDDEGREELTEDCYNQLIEPYLEKADDDVQAKVHKIVAFYVKKYTNDPNAKDTEEPDGDDMDWSDKTDKGDSNKGDSNNGDQPNEKKTWLDRTGEHVGKWIQDNNDMLVKNGVLNDSLYGHKEKTQGMLNAWKDTFGSAKKTVDAAKAVKNFFSGKKDKNKETTQAKKPVKKEKKHEMDWS